MTIFVLSDGRHSARGNGYSKSSIRGQFNIKALEETFGKRGFKIYAYSTHPSHKFVKNTFTVLPPPLAGHIIEFTDESSDVMFLFKWKNYVKGNTELKTAYKNLDFIAKTDITNIIKVKEEIGVIRTDINTFNYMLSPSLTSIKKIPENEDINFKLSLHAQYLKEQRALKEKILAAKLLEAADYENEILIEFDKEKLDVKLMDT